MMRKYMRKLLFVLLLIPCLAFAKQETVIIDINGMTCQFCVLGLRNTLSKIPGVKSVQVSLKLRKARVVMNPDKKADISAIKKAVRQAGYTPGKHHIIHSR